METLSPRTLKIIPRNLYVHELGFTPDVFCVLLFTRENLPALPAVEDPAPSLCTTGRSVGPDLTANRYARFFQLFQRATISDAC